VSLVKERDIYIYIEREGEREREKERERERERISLFCLDVILERKYIKKWEATMTV